MKLVFFCNYLNHHQVLVADELYRLLGSGYAFVATLPRNEKELKGGADYSSRPYCILAAESAESHERALDYARTADVCVFGACSQEYAVCRAVHHPGGLSFECGERWLKRGWLNVLSPVLRTWWLNYYRYYRKANFFKLCSGAFAAGDDRLLGAYKDRHYKWGYFSEVPFEYSHLGNEMSGKPIRLMWCARFIWWKHPELAIECAKRLKTEGYEFLLDMYGDGVLRPNIERRIRKEDLSDKVKFRGNVSNNKIREAMKESDIFLFTSDRQEGWGVVANEAMAAGCCLVASDRIGAAPYLIRDGLNGYMFRDGNACSLFKMAKHLIDYPKERMGMAEQARKDMINIWSPRNAAESLLQLVDDLQNERGVSVKEGPCSKA